MVTGSAAPSGAGNAYLDQVMSWYRRLKGDVARAVEEMRTAGVDVVQSTEVR